MGESANTEQNGVELRRDLSDGAARNALVLCLVLQLGLCLFFYLRYPLVLHGASSVLEDLVEICNAYGAEIPGARGVPEEMIAEARRIGVRKVNIDTDLRLAFTGAIRKHMAERPADFDPRKYLGPARDAVRRVVLQKLDVLGCVGKAD